MLKLLYYKDLFTHKDINTYINGVVKNLFKFFFVFFFVRKVEHEAPYKPVNQRLKG